MPVPVASTGIQGKGQAFWPLIGMLLLFLLWLSPSAAEEPVCGTAGGESCGGSTDARKEAGEYFWPTAHGPHGAGGVSQFVGPFDLNSSLAWTWQHPEGEFAEMPLGAVIDDKKNVYVSGDTGIWKLSPEGKLIWSFEPPWPPGAAGRPNIPNGASLYEGAIYVDTTNGIFYALDMETGRILWERNLRVRTCTDTGVVVVHEGVLVTKTSPDPVLGMDAFCRAVTALNASDGSSLWEYEPDNPVWNLMVQFLGDGTLAFQDMTGRAYRNFASNGSNIWKSGGEPKSWTDGEQNAATPNGILYAVSITPTPWSCEQGALPNTAGRDCPGKLHAFNLSNGNLLWEQTVPRPPNSFPVVGHLYKGAPLSVVIPIGQQPSCESFGEAFLNSVFPRLRLLIPKVLEPHVIGVLHEFFRAVVGDGQASLMGKDLPTDIYAFDAMTGKFQWNLTGPTHFRYQCPADEKGLLVRFARRMRMASCPNPWSAPRIGGDGTLYVGNQKGLFFAIKDVNADGEIDPKTEVSSFDCGAEFSSIGSAHAPGMVVIASAAKVYAFKS